MHAEDAATAALLGMRTRTYRFQPVAQIKLETDFQFRYRSPSWLLVKRKLTMSSSSSGDPRSLSGG